MALLKYVCLLLLISISLTICKASQVPHTPFHELTEYKKGETWGFKNAELNRVLFSETDLWDVDFSGAKLSHCIFKNSKFNFCNFNEVELDHCRFTDVTFNQCKLSLNRAWSVTFINSHFKSMAFWRPNTPATHIYFIKNSFNTVDFSHYDLSKHSFDECTFQNLKIDYGKLSSKIPFQKPSSFSSVTGAIWLNLSENEQKVWTQAGGIASKFDLCESLRLGNSYKYIDFHSALLQGCDFRGVDFSGYMLNHASLDNCNLEGVKFHNAHLVGTNFNNSNLKNAVFHGTELWGADFSGADLSGASFEGADIENANFSTATGKPKEGLKQLQKRSNYHWNKFWRSAESIISSLLIITAVIGWFIWLGQSIYIFVKKMGSPYKELFALAIGIHFLSFPLLITFSYHLGVVIFITLLGLGLLGLLICLVAWLSATWKAKLRFNYFLWTYVSLILYCPGMISYCYLMALLSSV